MTAQRLPQIPHRIPAGRQGPDEVFKDRKNHVLHVRDNFWGGAPAAAREWYRRTRPRDGGTGLGPRRLLRAGVMSHYVVDPVQPFHTGQTGGRRRHPPRGRVELLQGLPRKSSPSSRTTSAGPSSPFPAGDDWLEQMIRASAPVARQQAL